ncbi:MAG: MarR family transcriptional regulator [Planctomycetota bacterium]
MPKLQHELRKRNAFESLEQEAMLSILRTSDQFQNRFGKLFREFGLTASQYNVLRILRGEGKPMPVLEIAERMIQMVPAITGLIDRLEKLGLVKRERCQEDRRVIYVALMEQGLSLLSGMDEPVNDLHRKLMGHLTSAELEQLIQLLEKARANMSAAGG